MAPTHRMRSMTHLTYRATMADPTSSTRTAVRRTAARRTSSSSSERLGAPSRGWPPNRPPMRTSCARTKWRCALRCQRLLSCARRRHNRPTCHPCGSASPTCWRCSATFASGASRTPRAPTMWRSSSPTRRRATATMARLPSCCSRSSRPPRRSNLSRRPKSLVP